MLRAIPYDSLTLAAIMAEVRNWVGARVQRIWQPDADSVVFELHLQHRTTWLCAGWDAEFYRLHLSTRKPPGGGDPSNFCMTLRARLDDSRLLAARQLGFDRIAELQIGDCTLICELMGKHSNTILVDSDRRVVSAGKMVGRSKSMRPVLAGKPYELPPHSDRPSLLSARDGDDLKGRQGASPFLLSLLAAGLPLETVAERVRDERYSPVLVPELGAYPISVAPLGYREHECESISGALSTHFDQAIPIRRLQIRSSRLTVQLERVLLARETAIQDLESAQDAASRSGARQRMGELILAYQSQILPGGSEVLVTDYDGNALSVPLDPQLSPVENANRYFDKAKRAKSGSAVVSDQLRRQREDRLDVQELIARLGQVSREAELDAIEQEATRRRWLISQRLPTKKEAAPYGGKRIREMLGPLGWMILVGENAEGNDYLTLRVAKPDDWWFHVRGSASAHVVIPTKRQPGKVPREVIEFAAKVTLRHSGQKHASFVPVDYTLRRYVRKVKGAPLGTVLYTHEKTLHIGADSP